MGPLARIVLSLGSAIAVCTCTATPALAAPFGHHHGGGHGLGGSPGQDYSDPQGDLPFPVPLIQPALPTGSAQTEQAEITGYSFQDNTPEGSATISMPVLHRVAGGTGTFADPITTAVPGGADDPETPKGTKLYVAKLRRYFIVEDSGATAEGGKHFDLYVDGQGFSRADSEACMDSYTGTATIILNPPPREPVTPGPLTGPGGCRITGTSTGAPSATDAPTSPARHTHRATADDGGGTDDQQN
jgi:hypothetical protein